MSENENNGKSGNGQAGMVEVMKLFGLRPAGFRSLWAEMTPEDKADLRADVSGHPYSVSDEQRDAARLRCKVGGYARTGGENLMTRGILVIA